MKYELFLMLLLLIACSGEQSKDKLDPELFAQEIKAWDESRVKYLKSKEGWLNLAGLFWLEEGRNTFGSASDNDLVFPKHKIPAYAGYFLLNQNVVSMHALDAVFQANGLETTGTIIYHPDSARITIDYYPLNWFVIKRENKYAIRLRDFEHAELKNFHGIERFPVDVKWRLNGRLERASAGETMNITNVFGQTGPMKVFGRIHFRVNGKQYQLIALDEGTGGDLFVIFSDDTNARETYGAGRYMYVQWPKEGDEHVIIDFNKAYNPPCAFTEFATCPLPPKENVLPIAVNAGEKNYGAH